jgi:hypothetical protein
VSNGERKDETRKTTLFKKLQPHLSGLSKKIRHDFDIVSRNYNGSVCYFFKKLPGEEHCSECWDNDIGGSNNSNCQVCGGTGFLRYFSRPFKTVCGPISWQQETYSVDNPGKTLANPSVSINALADVVMTTDDIIYYKNTAEFYRVTSRTVSELKAHSVLQTLNANLIPSNYTDSEICKKLLQEDGIL